MVLESADGLLAGSADVVVLLSLAEGREPDAAVLAVGLESAQPLSRPVKTANKIKLTKVSEDRLHIKSSIFLLREDRVAFAIVVGEGVESISGQVVQRKNRPDAH